MILISCGPKRLLASSIWVFMGGGQPLDGVGSPPILDNPAQPVPPTTPKPLATIPKKATPTP